MDFVDDGNGLALQCSYCLFGRLRCCRRSAAVTLHVVMQDVMQAANLSMLILHSKYFTRH